MKKFKDFLLNEAISNKSADSAAKLIATYLSKHVGQKFYHMPGLEEFSNSKASGYGIRFFYGKNSVRFNWKSVSVQSAALHSIDIWIDGGHNPTLNVKFDVDVSLVKSLPIAAAVLKNPRRGNFSMVTENNLNYEDDCALIEEHSNFIGQRMLKEDILDDRFDDFVNNMERGEVIIPKNFKVKGTYERIYLKLRKARPELFNKQGSKWTPNKDKRWFASNKEFILGSIGAIKVTVSSGGSSEEYAPSKEEQRLEADAERVVFERQLEDLCELTRLVITGMSNALFVAGRGGIGKTHNVEKTLAEAGLSDGSGYFKNTGTASPVGIYGLLYENRDGIVFFDDSDGALADQDGRNLIKAATDTKKIRKLAWTKRPGKTFIDAEFFNEDDREPGTYPTHFEFSGKVIFISNLPIDKLDPDGALRTRALMINIDPTDMELIEFMKKISISTELETGSLTDDQRREVVDMIAQQKNSLNIRKMVRGLNIRAALGESSDWRHIVKNYA